MKCSQKICEKEAAFLYTWPGRDEAGACLECAQKLRNLASAMGLYLQLKVIQVNGDAPQEKS